MERRFPARFPHPKPRDEVELPPSGGLVRNPLVTSHDIAVFEGWGPRINVR